MQWYANIRYKIEFVIIGMVNQPEIRYVYYSLVDSSSVLFYPAVLIIIADRVIRQLKNQSVRLD